MLAMHAVVAHPGNALALRASFRKDIPVQIWAVAFILLLNSVDEWIKELLILNLH